jgi:hypothetical protein
LCVITSEFKKRVFEHSMFVTCANILGLIK